MYCVLLFVWKMAELVDAEGWGLFFVMAVLATGQCPLGEEGRTTFKNNVKYD